MQCSCSSGSSYPLNWWNWCRLWFLKSFFAFRMRRCRPCPASISWGKKYSSLLYFPEKNLDWFFIPVKKNWKSWRLKSSSQMESGLCNEVGGGLSQGYCKADGYCSTFKYHLTGRRNWHQRKVPLSPIVSRSQLSRVSSALVWRTDQEFCMCLEFRYNQPDDMHNPWMKV